MIDIRSFRFLIPPFLMLIAVWWIWVTQDSNSLSLVFQKFLFVVQDFKPDFFLQAVLALFGFGFVISTFGSFMLFIISKLFRNVCTGVAVVWNSRARNCLDSLFRQKEIWRQGEFCEQAVLSMAPRSMSDWVTRRYEYFITNFNSLVAIGFALILLSCLGKKVSLLGAIGIGVLVLPLFFNMLYSWYTAMYADHCILFNLVPLMKRETFINS